MISFLIKSNIILASDNHKRFFSPFLDIEFINHKKYNLFLCPSTEDYIKNIYVCDKQNDCLNGEDENDCKFRDSDYFFA